MPIVAPPQSQSSSSGQVVTTVQVFDYILDDAGKAVANATVQCVLNGNFTNVISPLVLIGPKQLQTTTDGNGYFTFNVIPNNNINPANTTYTIITPFRQYDITVPSGGPYQTTAVGILVTTPVALAPAVTSLTGPLTVTTGGLTVSAGGATITGGLTVATGTLTIPAGGFTMAGPLTLTAAASQIIPGATSFSVRDTANANDNLLVSNAGNVTVRGSLTVTGGGLTVSANGAAITGNSTVTGTLTVTSTINSQTISAAASLTGSLTVANGFTLTAGNATITAGDLSLTAGRLVFAAATSKIVPGATAFQLRDNADANTNVAITNAGLVTLRNALSIPPSAAGAVATTSYGSVEVKIAEVAGDGATNAITFSSIPNNFRTLVVELFGRATNAVTVNDLQVQLNGDTTAVYEWNRSNAAGGDFGPGASGSADTKMVLGYVTGSSAPANAAAHTRLEIAFANSATFDKDVTGSGTVATAYSANNTNSVVSSGVWRNAAPAAVSSIKLITSAGFFATTALAILRGKP